MTVPKWKATIRRICRRMCRWDSSKFRVCVVLRGATTVRHHRQLWEFLFIFNSLLRCCFSVSSGSSFNTSRFSTMLATIRGSREEFCRLLEAVACIPGRWRKPSKLTNHLLIISSAPSRCLFRSFSPQEGKKHHAVHWSKTGCLNG